MEALRQESSKAGQAWPEDKVQQYSRKKGSKIEKRQREVPHQQQEQGEEGQEEEESKTI